MRFRGCIGDIITGTVLLSPLLISPIIKIREVLEAELPHFDQRRFPDERDERPAGERCLHNQRMQWSQIRGPNATQPAVVERHVHQLLFPRTHPDLIRRLSI